MQKLIRRLNGRSAFTLIELMIVVVIVAILALVAIPLYRGNVLAAKMSEGIAGVGTVRTAMRVYAAGHGGSYPTISGAAGDGLEAYGIAKTDLVGKYFGVANYTVNSSDTHYTVSASLTDGSTTYTYAVDEDGKEVGTYTTGN